MISKDKFCEIIQHIGLLQEQSERINSVLRDPLYENVANDFTSAYAFNNPIIEQDLVDVLESMFDDTEHWISYFIYELRCGVDWKYGAVMDKNGEDIPLRNVSEFYDFLISQYIDDFIGGTD